MGGSQGAMGRRPGTTGTWRRMPSCTSHSRKLRLAGSAPRAGNRAAAATAATATAALILALLTTSCPVSAADNPFSFSLDGNSLLSLVEPGAGDLSSTKPCRGTNFTVPNAVLGETIVGSVVAPSGAALFVVTQQSRDDTRAGASSTFLLRELSLPAVTAAWTVTLEVPAMLNSFAVDFIDSWASADGAPLLLIGAHNYSTPDSDDPIPPVTPADASASTAVLALYDTSGAAATFRSIGPTGRLRPRWAAVQGFFAQWEGSVPIATFAPDTASGLGVWSITGIAHAARFDSAALVVDLSNGALLGDVAGTVLAQCPQGYTLQGTAPACAGMRFAGLAHVEVAGVNSAELPSGSTLATVAVVAYVSTDDAGVAVEGHVASVALSSSGGLTVLYNSTAGQANRAHDDDSSSQWELAMGPAAISPAVPGGVLYIMVDGFGGSGARAIVAVDVASGTVLWGIPDVVDARVNALGWPRLPLGDYALVLGDDSQHLYVFGGVRGGFGCQEADGECERYQPVYAQNYSVVALDSAHVSTPGVNGPVRHVGSVGDFPVIGPMAESDYEKALFKPYGLLGVDSAGVAYIGNIAIEDADYYDGHPSTAGMDIIAVDLATGTTKWSSSVSGLPQFRTAPVPAESFGMAGLSFTVTAGSLVVSADGTVLSVSAHSVIPLLNCHESVLEEVAAALAIAHAVLMMCAWGARRQMKESPALDRDQDDSTYVEMAGLSGSRGGGGTAWSNKTGGGGAAVCYIIVVALSITVLVVTTVIGAMAQIEAAKQMDLLTDPLADMQTFRDNHLETSCTSKSPTPYNLTSMCYCTGTYWPRAQLTDAQCHFTGGASDCDQLLDDVCGCDAAFDSFTCSSLYTRTGGCDPEYDGSNITNVYIGRAFKACSDHYNTLELVMWVELYLHGALSSIVAFLKCCRARRPFNKKLRNLASIMNTVAHVLSVSLWTYAYILYSEGDVCTNPGAAASHSGDGGSITAATLLSVGVPGCSWKKGTNWPTLESTMLKVVNTAIFVHIFKPVMYLVAALASCLGG